MFSIGIIGRPNVGKSTLFNRIAGKRIAITDDRPGVTRDRIETTCTWLTKSFKLVDTAGFDLKEDIIKKEMQEQFFKTIQAADFFIVVSDLNEGIHSLDEVVVDLLRKANKPFMIAVNKVDSNHKENLMGEFYALGANLDIIGISALHGRNVAELLDYVIELIPDYEEEVADDDENIKIAVIGRPNVGKSSLINAWLGEERVIVTPIAGTTRDSIDTEFEYNNTKYLLTDTAGIRKKSVMFKDPIEKYGYYRSMDAITRADIAVAVIDGVDGINERDIKVIADAWEAGRPVVIAINKSDIMDQDPREVKNLKLALKEKLRFLYNPPIVYISAVTGKNCFKVFTAVKELYANYTKRITTSQVNEALQEALDRHQAPSVIGTKRLKFYYMTQISTRPPYFVAFVNFPRSVHFSYERFILNVIRDKFSFYGIPIRLSIRGRSKKDAED